MKLPSTAPEITELGSKKLFKKPAVLFMVRIKTASECLPFHHSCRQGDPFFPHLPSNTHYGSNPASRGNKIAVWME